MINNIYNCPHCNQSLEISNEFQGQTISCPICKGSITTPKNKIPVASIVSITNIAQKSTKYNKMKRHLYKFLRQFTKKDVKQGAVIACIICFIIGLVIQKQWK